MIGFLLGMVCGAGLLLVACQVYKTLMVRLTSPALMRAIHERLDRIERRVSDDAVIFDGAIQELRVAVLPAPTERAPGRSV